MLTSNITGQNNVTQNTVESYLVSLNPGSTYDWGVTGGILQSGLGTNSVDVLWNTAGQGGVYVIETDANGCIGDTVDLVVSIFQSTNLTENHKIDISIYPNPFSQSTIITIPKLISSYNLNLYDITGQKVLEEKEAIAETYELKRGSLSKGVYFLEIQTTTDKYIKRVVVN